MDVLFQDLPICLQPDDNQPEMYSTSTVLCKLVGTVKLEVVTTRHFKLQPSLSQPTCKALYYSAHILLYSGTSQDIK